MNRFSLEQIYNLSNDYLINLNKINNHETVDFLELRYNAIQIFIKSRILKPEEYDYVNNPRFYNLFFNYITNKRIQCLNGIKDMNSIQVLKYLLGRNFPTKTLSYYGKLRKKLGGGNFGTVYDYGKYAVKITKRKSNETFASMLNEVLPTKYVKSPYIIKPVDVIIDDNLNIVMNKAKYDLKVYLKSKDYNVNDIPRIAFSILNGMIHYFNTNMIHRDLKLRNVLMFNNGQVKIADLGFTYPEFCPSKSQNLFGTDSYKSLNMLLGDPFYGPNIDIWSFGCILAELYLKRGLFLDKNRTLIIERIMYYLGIPTLQQLPIITEILNGTSSTYKNDYKHFILKYGPNFKGRGLPTKKLRNPHLDNLLNIIFDYDNFHINNNYDLITTVYEHPYFDSVRSDFTENCIISNCEKSLLLNQSHLTFYASQEPLKINFTDFHSYYKLLYPNRTYFDIETEIFLKIKYILDFYTRKVNRTHDYHTFILISMNLAISSMGHIPVNINSLRDVNGNLYDENFYLMYEKDVIEKLNWNLEFVTSFTIFKSKNQSEILKELYFFNDLQALTNSVESLLYYAMFTTIWYNYLPAEQLEIAFSILLTVYSGKYNIFVTIGSDEDIIDAMKQYLNIDDSYISYKAYYISHIRKGMEKILKYLGKLN